MYLGTKLQSRTKYNETLVRKPRVNKISECSAIFQLFHWLVKTNLYGYRHRLPVYILIEPLQQRANDHYGKLTFFIDTPNVLLITTVIVAVNTLSIFTIYILLSVNLVSLDLHCKGITVIRISVYRRQ